ncbi:MAG: cytidylate kinase family protein [Desulfobacterota bacterium]|nr:cytidylate kinase family protein [Thermodesulfobacteriota bacterium]
MYFITVSSMLGTNGEAIARKVAKDLNYTFYGEEELLKAAEDLGYLSDLQKLGEKSPALWERLFSEKPKIYLDRLQSVIYEVAKQGDAVFFGKGSQLLLHSFDCAFHVLIIGSLEKRIRRLMEERGVAQEVAERMIQRSDEDKKGFIHFAFHEEWLNPHLYDLVLNTDKLSVDFAARMIVEGAKTEEIKSCGVDSILNLRRLSLQRQVESALLESGLLTSHVFFSIEADETVRVFGMVNSQEAKEKIEALIKRVKGVQKVSNDLLVVQMAMSGL